MGLRHSQLLYMTHSSASTELYHDIPTSLVPRQGKARIKANILTNYIEYTVLPTTYNRPVCLRWLH